MAEKLDDIITEKVMGERKRRMTNLVQNLYSQKFEPEFKRIRPIRAKNLIVALSLVVIMLVSAMTLYSYNRFVDMRETVLADLSHVDAALQRRSNLFANLVNLTLNQAAIEKELFSHIADVRNELRVSSETLKSLSEQDAQKVSALAGKPASDMQSALAKLMAIVEQYPDIKSSDTYRQLLDKLVEIENRIAERRHQANEDMRIFNQAITLFPWNLLAKITRFERFEYFKADDNAYGDPAVTPQVFEQLIPMGKLPNIPAPAAAGQTAAAAAAPQQPAAQPAPALNTPAAEFETQADKMTPGGGN